MILFDSKIHDSLGQLWYVDCRIEGSFKSADATRTQGSEFEVVDLQVKDIDLEKFDHTMGIRLYNLQELKDRFPKEEVEKIEAQAKDMLLKEFAQFMEDCYPRR